MSFSQRERALGHQKGAITTVGNGTPDAREGSDGDLTLRKVAKGLVLYIKSGNRWYDVNNLIVSTPADAIEWHSLVLANSWVTYSGTFEDPSYCKDNNGFVHLRGLLKDGSAADAVMCTLPPGFRPSRQINFNAIANDASCKLVIKANGEVNAAAGGSTAWTSISGVIFYVG
jgi:hypothetical protein